MKILCLNCRGLGQPEAVQEVCSLVALHRPALVFLSETRIFDNSVEYLKRKLNFPNGVGVGSFGRGGGLALLWTHEVCVKLQSYNKLHIDVAVLDPLSDEEKWHFTGFYGEPRRENRWRSWALLQHLKQLSGSPWLCAGDFNEILEATEQFGGVTRPEGLMDGFREAVSTCGFTDLGFIGLPYTWDNRQHGSRNVKARLDRVLADANFLSFFKDVKVWHVQTTESDHCCLVIECLRETRNNRRRRRNFKYENMWRRDPSYADLVKDSWGAATDIQDLSHLQGMLGQMQASFQNWEFSVFGSVKRDLAKLRRELETVRQLTMSSGPTSRERQLMSCISELLAREEIMEKQRSRITWLKDGDRNTKMFQAKAKERARCNKISALY